ncbi:stonustoxin subunit alpha-like [Archocentrus centrarchus]|uniref:stonustoxin subunit alpha-like n=1 Tax=Archocentrus centrarchus TaxID=63155 RepID=UPI0011EA0E69|nr:stonustoxin subunit alpha-like [Archocentrus centrarchus]
MLRMVMQRFEESPSKHIQMPIKETDTLTKRFYLFPGGDVPEEVKQRSAGEEDLCRRLNLPWVESDGVRWVRSDLRKHSCHLTINTNTVYEWFKLSDNNRKVTRVDAKQPYPDHPDRFDRPQLLCTDSLTGRCYWEVEWSGDVSIAMSYRGIKKSGNSEESLFGFNNQSWSLDCSYCYSVLHNNKETSIFSFHNSKDFKPVSNRAAVYVDLPAGTLSFFTIYSDTLIHLHTFNSTFTEPLYPGFGLWSHHSSVRLC